MKAVRLYLAAGLRARRWACALAIIASDIGASVEQRRLALAMQRPLVKRRPLAKPPRPRR